MNPECKDNARRMLDRHGKLLGHDGDAAFYVLDGKVWRDMHNAVDMIGDYFEFLARRRKGGLPTLTMEK